MSLEFVLPRRSFDNVASTYLTLNSRILNIVSAYSEFTGSEELEPRLVFTSTSDPILAFTAYVSAAYGVTRLINGLLTVAKNAIDIYKTVKLLRDNNESSIANTIDAGMKDLIERQVRELVEKNLQGQTSLLDDGRLNEIKSKIIINSIIIVPIISDGAMLSLSPESLEQISFLKIDPSKEGQISFEELIKDSRKKEDLLRETIRLNDGQSLLKITDLSKNKDNIL